MVNVTGGLLLQTLLYVVHQNNSDAPVADLADVKCFGIYGCFPNGEPWKTKNRPVSYFPVAPEDLNVRYPTFTRQNIKIPYFLDPERPEKITLKQFNPSGPFIFIAHGYLEGGDKPWVQKMVEALLSLPQNINATIVVIDWREASSPPYAQAAANIRLLGMMTAHLIYDIVVELNLDNVDNFHFVGHSLGAHLGGYTGAALQEVFELKLGRITGLDPADPFFANVGETVRLDTTDAQYVDIIHTDATPFISGGLGITENIGHVDFFPNGGANQPGCSKGMMQYINSKNGSLFDGFRDFLGCSHTRSYDLFIESVTTTCPFLAISCSTYERFAKGLCFECGKNEQHCIRFGYHSINGFKRLAESNTYDSSSSLTSYLLTGANVPFCHMHYRVTVNISSSIESATHGGDVCRLWITLINKNGKHSEEIPLEAQAGYHKPGTQKTVMISGSDVGVPVSAKIECKHDASIFNPLTWRILMSPKVYISWIHVESLEHRKSITVCPINGNPLIANDPTIFQVKNCKNIHPIKIYQPAD